MDPSDLASALADVESRYRARHPHSARRHASARSHLPGGNTHTVLHYSPFPLTFAAGRGNRLTDIDGLDYLDLLGEYSAGLYGHSNPVVQAALRQALDDGLALGGPNVYEARLAEAVCARFPSMNLVRFTNSGTEANLMALSIARARLPGRTRLMVFGGAYHGSVFQFRHGGAALNAPFDWLIGTYNDTEGTRAQLRSHGASLAAVIVEPMLGGGCIVGSAEFLAMLRDECTASGTVLIFDEVMTSRLSSAGRQGLLGIRPDMTTLGKYLGGGASFGAFGGRRDIMQRLDPAEPEAFSHAGTFNNNVLSMAGGLAGLTQVFSAAESSRINELGDRLRTRLNEMGAAHRMPFQATGAGSLIGLHFAGGIIQNGADIEPAGVKRQHAKALLEGLFHLEMIDRGYYLGRRGFISLSLPTTAADCEAFAAAVDQFLAIRGSLIPVDLADYGGR